MPVLVIRFLHLTPTLDLSVFPHSKLEYTKNRNACTLYSSDLDSAMDTFAKIKSMFPTLHIDYLIPKNAPSPLSCTLVPHDDLIPGLLYQADFISHAEETGLLAFVDSQPWDTSIKRRVQHYGATFNYTTKKIDSPSVDRVRCIPSDFFFRIKNFLGAHGILSPNLSQLTVNEYLAHVGISQHCDTHSVIGDVLVVISVGGGVDFDMRKPISDVAGTTRNLWIAGRSLLVMTGEARYGWTHGIARRARDRNPEGTIVQRQRRVSFTFREVREAFECKCDYEALCDSRVGVELPTRMGTPLKLPLS